MKKITITDIARECNVSTATVSRVLKHHPLVSDAIRQKVMAVAKRRNFVPRHCQRHGIVLILTSGSNFQVVNGEYFHTMLNAICHQLYLAQYSAIIVPENDYERVSAINFDGIINVTNNLEIVHQWERNHVAPFIQINEKISTGEFIYSVCSDLERGIEDLIRFLYEAGHRKIGLLLIDDPKIPGFSQRAAYFTRTYFLRAIERRGMIADAAIAYCPDPEHYSGIAQLLDNGITALVAISEGWDIFIMHMLRQFHVQIPEMVSVIVGETPKITECSNLSSIGHDYAAIAQNCIKILQTSELERRQLPHEILTPYLLHIRKSVKQLCPAQSAKEFFVSPMPNSPHYS